jgi:hypothetical protein
LGALLLCIALLDLFLVAFATSRRANVDTTEGDNYAAATAAAEYGANLAVAQLTSGVSTEKLADDDEKLTVAGDWVGGTKDAPSLFTIDGKTSPDQRRIAGVMGDHEFRVRIRSARLAHDSNNDGANPTMSPTWLSDPGKFRFGVDRDFEFGDVYEITATAQNLKSGRVGGLLAARPVVQTVIGVQNDNPMGSILNDVGVGHIESPQNFQLAKGTSDTVVFDTEGMPLLATADSVSVIGEDHRLDKYVFPLFDIKNGTNGSILRYFNNTDMDLYRARHRYWRYGRLTVHRRTDIKNRDFANPLRPATTNFHIGTNHWISKSEAKKYGFPEDYYTKEDYFRDRQGMIALDEDATYDDYLMGGKGSGVTGRTVTIYKDANGEYRIYEAKHSQASKWGDNFYSDNEGEWDDDGGSGDGDGESEEDEGDDDDGYDPEGPYGGNDDGSGGSEEDEDESDDEIIHELMVEKAEDLSRIYINIAAVSPVDRDGVLGVITTTPDIKRLEDKYGAAKVAEWKRLLLLPGMHLPPKIKEWWYQNYIGQYTNRGVKAEQLYKAFPHVPDKKAEWVRPMNLFILTRPYSDKPGEQRRLALVREYVRRDKKTGMITGITGKWYKPDNKYWQWEGNYIWVPVRFLFRSGGVVCAHVAKGVNVGAHTVPRLFTWQELVGAGLVKRGAGDPFAGEPVVDEKNNTVFETDEAGKRIAVGFDEHHQQGDYMGYAPLENTTPPTQEEIAAATPFAGGVYGTKLDFGKVRATQDRRIIWVRDHAPILASTTKKREALDAVLRSKPHHGLVPHAKLNDFAIERVFTDGSKEVTHKVVGVTVAMEAKQERMFHRASLGKYTAVKMDPEDGRSITNTEYRRIYDDKGFRYNGMVFNVYIAPFMLGEAGKEGSQSQDLANLEWWERDQVDGLTGLQAIPAISTNKDPATLGETNVTAANFSLLGHTPKDDEIFMRSMHSAVASDYDYKKALEERFGADDIDGAEVLPAFSPGFPRAVFGKGNEAGILTESCLEGVKKNEALLENRKDSGEPVYFYYTETDLRNVAYASPSVYFDSEGVPDYPAIIDHIVSSNPQFITLGDNEVTVPLRFADIRRRWDQERMVMGTMRESDQYNPDTQLAVPNSSYKVLDKSIHARQMAGEIVGFAVQSVPVVNTDGFTPLDGAAVESRSLGFLAGEMVQEMGSSELRPDGKVPVRHIDKTQPDGTEVVVRDFTASTPEAAVALCYGDYYVDDPAGKAKVLELYGEKDQRRAIGFHRFGPEEEHRDVYGQDHYEVVSLGVAGFNPYSTAQSGTEQVVALEKRSDSGEFSPQLKYGVQDTPGDVPTFVFDKPIDGAGAMIVNGNLVIRSRFAYHGTLIVLGDLIVDPLLQRGKLVYGGDGNPVDAEGNSLTLVGGVWHYTWVSSSGTKKLSDVYLDSKGKPLTDKVAGGYRRVEPATFDTYDSELVIQGNLALRGKMVNNTVVDERDESGDTYVSGKVRLFWSSEAIENTGRIWADTKTRFQRMSWHQNDDINVGDLWTNTMEP